VLDAGGCPHPWVSVRSRPDLPQKKQVHLTLGVPDLFHFLQYFCEGMAPLPQTPIWRAMPDRRPIFELAGCSFDFLEPM
jgi:hypothetical protein